MNVIDLQDDSTDKKIMEIGTVKDSDISGKVKGCYYADGSRIIVEADKLYLYDTAKGETIASADISMKELCVQTYADGANLTIIKKADYKVAVEEVQRGESLLIMPQSFDKNNGTLLMLDAASNTEKTLSFSSRSEGKDGVYCSGKRKYVAASIVGEDSVTINIYDTASGKSIHTETVQDCNSAYFLCVPQILSLVDEDAETQVRSSGVAYVRDLCYTIQNHK